MGGILSGKAATSPVRLKPGPGITGAFGGADYRVESLLFQKGVLLPVEYQSTNRIAGNRRWIALSAVMVTMFFSSLDQTVVSTAMPTIVGDLQGFDIYAWVFTAYMMTSAVTVPLYGKLSDVYGRKPFFLFGLGVFIIGSALSGQAHSMMELILYRGLQGIGGGAMMIMPRATVGDIFNPKELGKGMGLVMSVFGLATIIGPFLGGWITDHWSWRWIFYINLPVALLAMAAVYYALPTIRQESRHHIDWSGSFLLVVGLIPILLAFTWAGSKYAWQSWQILGLFALGVLLLIGFVVVERRAAEPVLSPALFGDPVFTATAVMGLLISISLFGSLMFLPIFVQGVVGLSPEYSGEVLTPMMLSFMVASVVGGLLITRTGKYKLQAVVGSLILIYGIFLLTRMTVSTTWPVVIQNMVVLGLGVGAVMPLITVIVQNAFPYRLLGVVNSTQQFVSSLGAIIISPIYGTILANTFNARLPQYLAPELSGALAKIPSSITAALRDPQVLITAQAQELIKVQFAAYGPAGINFYDQFIQAVKLSLTDGITRLFTIGLVFAVLTLITALLLREIPLKRDEFYREGEKAGPERSTAAPATGG